MSGCDAPIVIIPNAMVPHVERVMLEWLTGECTCPDPAYPKCFGCGQPDVRCECKCTCADHGEDDPCCSETETPEEDVE